MAIGEVPLPPSTAPTQNSSQHIIQGPDGNLWFTENTHTIGRITPTGTITEFPIDGNGTLGALAAGPDGNVWFVDNGPQITVALFGPQAGSLAQPSATGVDLHTDSIDRITPDGTVTVFTLPGVQLFNNVNSLTTGPDGNLWFTVGSEVDRITPTGEITAFPLPSQTSAHEIIPGPNGNLWFTYGYNQVGQITTDGVVTIQPTTLVGAINTDQGFVVGPDGNFWVLATTYLPSGGAAPALERINPDGSVTSFTLPAYAGSIASGPDGNLWLTDSVGELLRFALDGSITTFVTPTVGTAQGGITAGPDGNLWFTEAFNRRIGQVVLNAPVPGVLDATGPTSLNATEGTALTGQVASFSQYRPGDTSDDYVASVDWGDGSTSLGSIVADGQGGFLVHGDHVYQKQGTYHASVTIVDVQLGDPGATATVSSSISVADAPLTPIPVNAVDYRGQFGPLLVARASAVDSTGTYTAIIDWGDGVTSIGTVQYGIGPLPAQTVPLQLALTRSAITIPPGGDLPRPESLSVLGDHVYAVDGDYTVRTTIIDEVGLSTVVVSTIRYTSPQVYSSHTINIEARAGVPTPTPLPPFTSYDPSTVGIFYVTGPNVSSSNFTATINWGDGSATTPATVSDMGFSSFSVQAGPHTYARVGTYHFSVTISGFGRTLVIGGAAHVTGDALTLTGGLSPSSDTGYSHGDGITADTTPLFQGNATPGSTVQLFARRSDGTQPFAIGQAVVGANGKWSVVSTPLVNGTYTITANETATNGRKLLTVAVRTGGAGSRLVVDTTGPRVTGATFDPSTSRITLTFSDNLSQVNPLGLLASGSVRLSRIKGSGASNIPLRVQSLKPGGGGVVLSLGHAVPDGRYVLQLGAGSVRDAAGNALDGEFRSVLPTGDGRPGGNFVGQFVTKGKALAQAQPIALSPPQQAQASRSPFLSGSKGRG